MAVAMMGCSEEDTVGPIPIKGIVTDGPQSRTAAVGASVELRNQSFEIVDEAVTDSQGVFELTGRAGAFVHMVTRGANASLPVSFAGETGLLEEFVVPSGQLWTFSEDAASTWRRDFDGCPVTDDSSGAMVVGEVRIDLGAGPADNPVEPFSFVRLERFDESEDGGSTTVIEACYLDAEGVYDEDQERTGIAGRFGMFGVPPGPWDLVAARDTAGGTAIVRQLIFVPEGGAVVRLPVYVTL